MSSKRKTLFSFTAEGGTSDNFIFCPFREIYREDTRAAFIPSSPAHVCTLLAQAWCPAGSSFAMGVTPRDEEAWSSLDDVDIGNMRFVLGSFVDP